MYKKNLALALDKALKKVKKDVEKKKDTETTIKTEGPKRSTAKKYRLTTKQANCFTYTDIKETFFKRFA